MTSFHVAAVPEGSPREMELSTRSTVWSPAIPTQLTRGPLAVDERCDVVVVGSGLCGAMTAFHLAQAGADVVIVDKRPLSTGSTVACTALIQYELDKPLVELMPRLGLADAHAVYRATRGALNDFHALVEDNHIDCDLQQRPTLFLAREDDDVVHLKHEAMAREQIGLEADYLDRAALKDRYKIARPGAIRSAVSYEIDPRKLAAQLLAKAAAMGARIYDRTALAGSPADGSDLSTTQGHRVSAGDVVLATGYEALSDIPELWAACSLRTTYALATKPTPESLWPERALLWELADPYFYARTTADDRVIVGGEDDYTFDPVERERLLPGKSRRLLDQLAATTGLRSATVDRAWAASFAHTEDGLPLIGTREQSPHCHFNLGLGGNGILFGLIGAQIIRDTIAGRHHSSARLFGFRRATLRRPNRRLRTTQTTARSATPK